mmetsp:Transcript_20966/g.40110  ORF Transcript_20966/g.40110 Transcript_20966/m.40110 type:complete len:260 (-) Transcript_20966:1017-1796(-)
MHPTLALSGGAAQLEADLLGVQLLAEALYRRQADVLQTMFDALQKVWNIVMKRTFILDATRNSLCNFELRLRAKIAVVGALLHGIDGAHATIPLQANSVVRIEVFPGRLLGPCQQTAAHHGARPQAQCLHNVTGARNSTICNDWHSKHMSKLCDIVHGGGLRPPTSADFLSGANGTDAHTYTQGICTAIDEILCLPLRDNVTGDYLEIWKFLFHPPDHLMLVDAIALTAVNADGIHAGADQGPCAVPVFWARPDCCCDD